jgi:hypothetical protein
MWVPAIGGQLVVAGLTLVSEKEPMSSTHLVV